MIDPWSILNETGPLLLIVDLFASLTPDLLLTLTQFLVYSCLNWSSYIKSSSDFWDFALQLHSTIDRPLINHQWSWSSTVGFWLVRISDPRYIAPTDPLSGILLVSLVFCYQIFLWFWKKIIFTYTLQLIDPWSILKDPGLLLLIVNWFASLTHIYCSLPLTWSLVFCCCHWCSAIKSSSDFRKISLHLHSKIDRLLINNQWPRSSSVGSTLNFISDNRSFDQSYWHVPSYDSVVIALLLSNLPLVFEKKIAPALRKC